ncbi:TRANSMEMBRANE GTPASE FZO [Salix koriyanagi]|uniref:TRANSMEMBRANE GTPASE FZO n=1 Tax=Salix koriyanagi TaxID=2511006 RepID=A0A9Q0QLQ9_9ROSI|nr:TRANSMEMBRANE GTPASE FZO [Salix koriyanagi]
MVSRSGSMSMAGGCSHESVYHMSMALSLDMYERVKRLPSAESFASLINLDSEDVIRGGSEASDLIDKAVSKSVGIVVLNGCSDGGGGSGKSLYEAACLVKSVVRDRAYLLIGERVDIAAAVNSRGVVLSDQGLPSIVARNMLMGSKSESVVVPLVARIVQTPNAALNASNSEDKKSQDELKKLQLAQIIGYGK